MIRNSTSDLGLLDFSCLFIFVVSSYLLDRVGIYSGSSLNYGGV